jgi:hypothetical protein
MNACSKYADTDYSTFEDDVGSEEVGEKSDKNYDTTTCVKQIIFLTTPQNEHAYS